MVVCDTLTNLYNVSEVPQPPQLREPDADGQELQPSLARSGEEERRAFWVNQGCVAQPRSVKSHPHEVDYIRNLLMETRSPGCGCLGSVWRDAGDVACNLGKRSPRPTWRASGAGSSLRACSPTSQPSTRKPPVSSSPPTSAILGSMRGSEPSGCSTTRLFCLWLRAAPGCHTVG